MQEQNEVLLSPSFRIMHSSEVVEWIDYIKAMLKAHPYCELHIGCDSQNYRNTTVYVTAVVFRFPGNGAHVIYRKEKVEKIPDMWSKLWGETQRSVDLANAILEECGIRVKQIDLDFNENPDYPSHKLLSASRGYISSLGFKSAAKPSLLMAAWAADSLCH